MKLGFHGFNTGALCDPDIIAAVLNAVGGGGL